MTRWISVWFLVVCSGCNGCGGGSGMFKDVSTNGGGGESDLGADPCPVGQVFEASWTTTKDMESWAEFGPEGDCGKFRTPSTTGTEHTATLVGLVASSTSCWQAVGIKSNGDEVRSDEYSLTVPPPPIVDGSGLSVPTVTVNDESGWSEPYVLFTMVLGAFPTHFVLDRSGEVVWADALGNDRQTVDGIQTAAMDGFQYNDFSADHSIDDSYVRTVDYCGNPVADVRTVNGHHAFVQLDDGRLAYLGLDIRDVDGYDDPVVADTLEVMETDGTVTQIWDAWDDAEKYPLAVDDDNTTFYPNEVDWTHCDTVTYSPERDSWVLSCRNINTVLEIDQTGQIVRSFGEFGDYAIDGYDLWSDIVGHPHNAVYLPDGKLMLLTMPKTGEWAGDTNGDGTANGEGDTDPQSLILELTVDDTAKTASIDWQFNDGYDAKVEGGPDRLANGNTLVNWGAAGVVQEVTPDQTVVWQAEFGIGNVTGHAHALSGFYPTE